MASYTIKYGDTLSGIAARTGKSISDLMRLNPSITDPNKIYAGRTISLGNDAPPTPAPKNTPAPNTQKSIADVARVTVPDYQEDPTTNALLKKYKNESTQEVDEEAIRRATRDRIQAQIDAINNATEAQISRFRQTTGKDRIGTSVAQQARGGRIGSDFGASEISTVETFNRQDEDLYRREANSKISALFDLAARDATSEIAAKRAAIEKSVDKYFEFLGTQNERKQQQLSNFVQYMLALGVDPTSLSDVDLKKLQTQYGVGKEQIANLYDSAKSAKADKDRESQMADADLEKTKADAEKARASVNQFDLSEGEARYVYDPETGTAKLVASRAKTYAPKGGSVSGDGTTLGYDDPNYTLESIRSSKGGRFLTQSELKPITDIQTIVGQAETLTGLINSVDTGPIMGIIKSANPYDTKAQLMKSAIVAIVPKLARGVYGEVGVLTDADIENYSKTIANLRSTVDVNKAVMAMTLDIATRSLANQLNSLSAGGRDVSNFEAIYTGLNSKATKLKSELGTTSEPKSTEFKSSSGKAYVLPY
jgi:LysM repeat protein